VVRPQAGEQRALIRHHGPRPGHVAAVEAERRAAARVALGQRLARGVHLDLQQLGVGAIDLAVTVGVDAPAGRARREVHEALVLGRRQVSLDRRQGLLGVVERREHVALVDRAAQRAAQQRRARVRGQITLRDQPPHDAAQPQALGARRLDQERLGPWQVARRQGLERRLERGGPRARVRLVLGGRLL
jgi:hypothetical protein